jgi:hypothetical protein
MPAYQQDLRNKAHQRPNHVFTLISATAPQHGATASDPDPAILRAAA